MKRLITVLTVACVVAGTMGVVWLAGCNGSNSDRPKAPKAQAYLCESCGHKFGMSLSIPVKQKLFPPIVCPKCGKRTAVRAYLYVPKGGGEPVIYRYEKYTDKQIEAMEKYRDSTPVEQLQFEDPETIFAMEQDAPLMKYADEDKWFNPAKEPAKSRPFSELQTRFKNIIPVFPESWPIEKRDNLKQR